MTGAILRPREVPEETEAKDAVIGLIYGRKVLIKILA
jgi:hypothetical protein